MLLLSLLPQPAEKKRTSSGGAGAVSGGGSHYKRMKAEGQPTSSVDVSGVDPAVP